MLYQKFEATHGTIIYTTRDKEPLSIFCHYVDMKSIIDQGARERERKIKKNDPSNRCLIGNVNSRDIDFFFPGRSINNMAFCVKRGEMQSRSRTG